MTLCILKVPLCTVELYQTRTTVDSQSQEDHNSLAPCKIAICICVFVFIYVFVFLFSSDYISNIRMSRKGNQARTRVSLASLPLREEKIRRSSSVGSAMILTGRPIWDLYLVLYPLWCGKGTFFCYGTDIVDSDEICICILTSRKISSPPKILFFKETKKWQLVTSQRVCEKCSMHFETTQFWDLRVRRIAWILGRGLCFLRSFLGFGPTWPRCPTWVNWTGHYPLQSFVTHEIIWKGEHKNWTILFTE